MAQFFTRKGDDGFSGLLGEGRVLKSDPRLEALGAVEEATAALGMARAQSQTPEIAQAILSVQRHLYQLMAELAATRENAIVFRSIGSEQVEWLEKQTEGIVTHTPLPGGFIIPGDNLSGAALDLARTVVRRAERRVVALIERDELENMELVRYLNRLSSLIFVMELHEIHSAGKDAPTLAKSS